MRLSELDNCWIVDKIITVYMLTFLGHNVRNNAFGFYTVFDVFGEGVCILFMVILNFNYCFS